MAMTIEELVGTPTLRTRLLAGKSGLETEILWAHTCELERPWEWLGKGDLLMTTGSNVPAESGNQVEFVRSLGAAGIAGLALAEAMDSPPLSDETAALAEELAFPILETAYEVPFVALSRVVAGAAQGETQARLTRVLRVYDAYRTAVQSGSPGRELLHRIGLELGHAIHLVDARSGRTLASTGNELSVDALQAIREKALGTDNLPGVNRIKCGDEQHIVLPIGTNPGWVMVADVSGVAFDLLILQHVNTIVTIEAERIRAESETRLAGSGRLLEHLVDGNVDSELVKDRLADFSLSQGPWQVIAAASDPSPSPTEIQIALDGVCEPHLVLLRQDALLILTRVSAVAVEAIDLALGDDAYIGVSMELQRISGVTDAVLQARWARDACLINGRRIAHYGQDRPLFLPSTVAEAESIVRTVLGPLIEYDQANGTDLVDSLGVFFDSNRSWQVASQTLHVHKQTLVYRMRRVSEITGRRLDALDDISELHLAMRTRELLLGT